MQRDWLCPQVLRLIGKETGNCVPAFMSRLSAVLMAGLFMLAIGVAKTWAGPPFLTDDPEPVDYQHGEFYFGSQFAKDKDPASGSVISGTAPHIEMNYGIVPNVMVHVLAPFAYNKPRGGATLYGYGDTELGVKYRFLNNEDAHFQMATFPLLEVPTGDLDRGTGTDHTRYFIPLWLQKSRGPWTTYGGGGWWRNPGDGNKNYWFFGWELQREMSKAFTLGAELFTQTKDAEDGKSRVGFNVGTIVNVTDDHHILFSAGSDINGDNRFSAYLAYQYTFGPKEEKK
jgi:hypothetical protein